MSWMDPLMDADQHGNQSPGGENPLYDVELYECLKNAIDKTAALAQWRQSHPNENPVLRGADLQHFPLSGAALQGADLEQADLRGAHLEAAELQCALLGKAKLQGASLRWAKLQRADLTGARLQNANLRWADLRGADLEQADLRGGCLEAAMLQGTRLEAVNLCGVYARFACVDGATLLNGCKFNDATDFAGVGLDSARIEERLKARLKRNIRKHHWEGHRYHWDPRLDNGEVPPVDRDHKGRYRAQPFLRLAWPFWWASDYGSSAPRLLFVFLGVSGLFAFLYLIPTFFSFEHPFMQGLDTYNGQELSWGLRCLRAFYLSIVTMTTLGFGDITPHPLSYVGHVLVIVQVCLGYLLLSALITRLAVLFQEVE